VSMLQIWWRQQGHTAAARRGATADMLARIKVYTMFAYLPLRSNMSLLRCARDRSEPAMGAVAAELTTCKHDAAQAVSVPRNKHSREHRFTQGRVALCTVVTGIIRHQCEFISWRGVPQ